MLINKLKNKIYQQKLEENILNTINYIKLISSILNKAVEWDYLQINVADKVSIPKNLEKQKKKVILYSYDEINLFISALEKLEDKELQIAIYTSFYTGARRGEVLALTFKDINFDKKTIDFNKNKVTTRGRNYA